MFDTVVASIEVKLSDTSMFPQRQTIDDVTRMWRNPRAGVYEPRLTYWLSGRLRIEFSIPKMADLDPLCNPSADDVKVSLVQVESFLYDTFEVDYGKLPHIKDWQSQRIDYAWNFEPSADASQYILMLQGLWLGNMSRHPHPDSEGVVWKARQTNYRWVKFYNKTREAGSKGTPVLRFEVSNYRRALAYMCEKWLGCGRSVGDLLHSGRGLYVMARMWDKLGLFGASWGSDAGLVLRLHHLFGKGAAGAMYALMCIHSYGTEAYKTHHLLSDNSYYMWKRRLSEHGLLSSSDVSLAPLSVPAVYVLKELQEQAGQNLGVGSSAVNMWPQKISPKNWQGWAKILQVSEKSPEISGLSRELELAWEHLYAETNFLEGLRTAVGQSESGDPAASAAAGTRVYGRK